MDLIRELKRELDRKLMENSRALNRYRRPAGDTEKSIPGALTLLQERRQLRDAYQALDSMFPDA